MGRVRVRAGWGVLSGNSGDGVVLWNVGNVYGEIRFLFGWYGLMNDVGSIFL